MPWVKFIKNYYKFGRLIFEQGDLFMMANEEIADEFINSGYAIYVNIILDKEMVLNENTIH